MCSGTHCGTLRKAVLPALHNFFLLLPSLNLRLVPKRDGVCAVHVHQDRMEGQQARLAFSAVVEAAV